MVMTFVLRTKAIAFKHCLMLSAGGLSACGLFTFWAFWAFWAQNAWATTSAEHQLSGNHFLSPSLKSMQSDASLNPRAQFMGQRTRQTILLSMPWRCADTQVCGPTASQMVCAFESTG